MKQEKNTEPRTTEMYFAEAERAALLDYFEVSPEPLPPVAYRDKMISDYVRKSPTHPAADRELSALTINICIMLSRYESARKVISKTVAEWEAAGDS